MNQKNCSYSKEFREELREKLDDVRIYADAVRRFMTNDKTKISAETGMSYPTVSKQLKKLINDSKLVEPREINVNGKTEKIKVPRSRLAHFLGIHIGAADSKTAIVDYSMRSVQDCDREVFDELQKRLIEKLGEGNCDELLFGKDVKDSIEDISSFVESVITVALDADEQCEIFNLMGVGVTFPGIINDGVIVFSPNIKSLSGISVHDLISQNTRKRLEEKGIPILVEHDTQASIIYEKEIMYDTPENGLYKKPNVACVFMGTGIGMGLIVGGTLLRGASGSIGEIGHIRAPRLNGCAGQEIKCECGKSNCMETCLRYDVFKCETVEQFQKETSSNALQSITKDDPRFNPLKEYIGYIINIAVNLLNVDVIIMTGRILRDIEDLRGIYDLLKAGNTIGVAGKACTIISGSNRTDAVALGTAISAYLRIKKGNEQAKIEWYCGSEQ